MSKTSALGKMAAAPNAKEHSGLTTAILSADESRELDRVTIMFGTPAFTLMQRAGAAAVREIKQRYQPCKTLVLCGAGNNGGDGLVTAELLRQAGWNVAVVKVFPNKKYSGDSALADVFYEGSSLSAQDLFADNSEPYQLIIDAIFGTGFHGALDDDVKELLAKVKAYACPVVAIDMPSGVVADTAEYAPETLPAQLTVTFTSYKFAHLLMPAKEICGQVVVCPIGVDEHALADLEAHAKAQDNSPAVWHMALPIFKAGQHKYHHGHALVFGGSMTGAARLAARSAQRSGAGLVSVASVPQDVVVYATNLDSVIVHALEHKNSWPEAIENPKITAVLMGCGCRPDAALREAVLQLLASKKPCVLDAGALTAFAEEPELLIRSLHAGVILTPHSGEFARLFGVSGKNKIEQVRDAAQKCGVVILLKGADTLIARPDDFVRINHNAPPWLATAGTGDVLAGIIVGLLAQGVAAFEAASIAPFIHGQAAQQFSQGMIAEDLIVVLPQVFSQVRK